MFSGSKFTFLFISVLSVLAGCGGGGSGDEPAKATAPIAASTPESDGTDVTPATPEEPEEPEPEEPEDPEPEEPEEPVEPEPETPAAASRLTEGVITGFGSVYVNGERYLVDSADIKFGDAAASIDNLEVGMVIRMVAQDGPDDSAPEAITIQYESQLKGTVSFIDIESSTFTVLGQQVAHDDITEFSLDGAPAVAVGDQVEISGFTDDRGVVHATYVRLAYGDENTASLKGFVNDLDSANRIFTLGDLTIDYAGAALANVTFSEIENGMWVTVSGTTNGDQPLLTAEYLTGVASDSDAAEDISLSGVVANLDGATGSFSLSQHLVMQNDDTRFVNGTKANLAQGTMVSVKAASEGDNLVAKTVTFKNVAKMYRTEGQVTDINTDTKSFTVNNVTFSVSGDTQYNDKSDLKVWDFSINDISVNDWLNVVSTHASDNHTTALKVERVEQDALAGKLRGVAQNITVEGLELAGVFVEFTSNTEFDSARGIVDFQTFADYAQAGKGEVQVIGHYSDHNVLEAYEVRLQESDSETAADEPVKVEFEGRVTKTHEGKILVAGRELQFTSQSEVTISCVIMTTEAFTEELRNGDVIWVEGINSDNGTVIVESAAL